MNTFKNLADIVGKLPGGTLRDTHDSYGDKYRDWEYYARVSMDDAADIIGPKSYEERARMYLEAESKGVYLLPIQIEWAKKVLNIKDSR